MGRTYIQWLQISTSARSSPAGVLLSIRVDDIDKGHHIACGTWLWCILINWFSHIVCISSCTSLPDCSSGGTWEPQCLLGMRNLTSLHSCTLTVLQLHTSCRVWRTLAAQLSCIATSTCSSKCSTATGHIYFPGQLENQGAHFPLEPCGRWPHGASPLISDRQWASRFSFHCINQQCCTSSYVYLCVCGT